MLDPDSLHASRNKKRQNCHPNRQHRKIKRPPQPKVRRDVTSQGKTRTFLPKRRKLTPQRDSIPTANQKVGSGKSQLKSGLALIAHVISR